MNDIGGAHREAITLSPSTEFAVAQALGSTEFLDSDDYVKKQFAYLLRIQLFKRLVNSTFAAIPSLRVSLHGERGEVLKSANSYHTSEVVSEAIDTGLSDQKKASSPTSTSDGHSKENYYTEDPRKRSGDIMGESEIHGKQLYQHLA